MTDFPQDHLCPKCGAYVMCDNDVEIERLRAALARIETLQNYPIAVEIARAVRRNKAPRDAP